MRVPAWEGFTLTLGDKKVGVSLAATGGLIVHTPKSSCNGPALRRYKVKECYGGDPTLMMGDAETGGRNFIFFGGPPL